MSRNFKVWITIASLAQSMAWAGVGDTSFAPTAHAACGEAGQEACPAKAKTPPASAATRTKAAAQTPSATPPANTFRTDDVTLKEFTDMGLKFPTATAADASGVMHLYGAIHPDCANADFQIVPIKASETGGRCSGIRIVDAKRELRQCMQTHAAACQDSPSDCLGAYEHPKGKADLSGLDEGQAVSIELVWDKKDHSENPFECADVDDGHKLTYEGPRTRATRAEADARQKYLPSAHCSRDAYNEVARYLGADEKTAIIRQLEAYEAEQARARNEKEVDDLIERVQDAKGNAALRVADELVRAAEGRPELAPRLAGACAELAKDQVDDPGYDDEDSDRDMAGARDFQVGKDVLAKCRKMDGARELMDDADMSVGGFLRNAYFEMAVGKCTALAQDGGTSRRRHRSNLWFLSGPTESVRLDPDAEKCGRDLQREARHEESAMQSELKRLDRDLRHARGDEKESLQALAEELQGGLSRRDPQTGQLIPGTMDMVKWAASANGHVLNPQTGARIPGLWEAAFKATCENAANEIIENQQNQGWRPAGMPTPNPSANVPLDCLHTPPVARALGIGQSQGQPTGVPGGVGGTIAQNGGVPVYTGAAPLFVNGGQFGTGFNVNGQTPQMSPAFNAAQGPMLQLQNTNALFRR
jgi:hypothetical protein